MRILFLHTFPLWGSGSGTFVRSLALELSKKNKIAIVCPDNRQLAGIKIYPVKLPFYVAFTGHPDWDKKDCRLYATLTPWDVFRIYRAFLKFSLKAVNRFKPDIIHVQHVSILSWVAQFIKAQYNINYIVTTHGTGLYTLSKNRSYYPLCLSSLRDAKLITAVSGDTRAWLLKIFGKEFSRKMRTIPNGINLEKYPKNKTINIINQKYNLDSQPIVLFTGKLTNIKGVEYLIKAARDIKAKIFIIGDGPERKHLEQKTKSLGLANITFLGYMPYDQSEEFLEFYYRANVFVAPSVWDEPFGFTILEAMAAGCPVVVTRKGGIVLMVKDGYNGFFVRPRNSSLIAEKVNRILENKELQKKMGENARRTVEEKFTWTKIAKKFLNIYQRGVVNNNYFKK